MRSHQQLFAELKRRNVFKVSAVRGSVMEEMSMRKRIQVYLTSAELDLLDRSAAEFGISRSAVLRRGLRAVAGANEWLTPASLASGAPPPPSLPIAPLEQLLAELEQARGG